MTDQSTQILPPNLWQDLAILSGLSHDLGKFLRGFQESLRQACGEAVNAEQDRVRHEWGSFLILAAMFDTLASDTDATIGLGMMLDFARRNAASFSSPFRHIDSLRDVVLYAVATHHRLPTYDLDRDELLGAKYAPIPSSKDILSLSLCPQADPCMSTNGQALMERLKNLILSVNQKDLEVRPLKLDLACMAEDVRDALIMADYIVSSIDYSLSGQPAEKNNLRCAANTVRLKDGSMRLNQPLVWHLENVGALAGTIFKDVQSGSIFSGKNEHADAYKKHLLETKSVGRFQWQNRVVSFINEKTAQGIDVPSLVMNVASTGAGKTLANQKIAAAAHGAGTFRMTSGFGMKVLTKESTRAYEREMKSAGDGISAVLSMLTGDEKIPYLLQDDGWGEIFNGAESVLTDPQTWPSAWSRDSLTSTSMLGAPILLATLDYIVPAGDPTATRRYLDAKLRLRGGTLIIDEIDLAQGAGAQTAVLRLLYTAGLCGVNAVVSSATLPKPLARAISEAYMTGLRRRGARKVNIFIVSSDANNYHQQFVTGDDSAINAAKSFCAQSLQSVGETLSSLPVITRGQIVNIESKGDLPHITTDTILESGARLGNPWPGFPENVRLSFGMIRLAHVRNVVALADRLASGWGDQRENDAGVQSDAGGTYIIKDGARHYLRVAAYHSYIPDDRRRWLEDILSNVLNRKQENPEAFDLLSRSCRLDVDFFRSLGCPVFIHFVVVASQIVETGRDYDFDYGQAEPSSAGSLVQMPGRIARHRRIKLPDGVHNLVILSRNLASLRPGARPFHGFIRPGLGKAKTHPEADVRRLLPLDEYGLVPISAGLRMDTSRPGEHGLAGADDASIEDTHRDSAGHVLRRTGPTERGSRDAFGAVLFHKYKLREERTVVRLTRHIASDGSASFEKSTPGASHAGGGIMTTSWEAKTGGSDKRPEINLWLSDRLFARLEKGGSGHVNIPIYNPDNLSDEEDKIRHDVDFGFYRDG